jgi:large subunit ribosomal protein L46
VVTPDNPGYEKDYYEWQEKVMRKYHKELPKEFEESEARKAENASTSGWQPAPRITKADESNDVKSLERKLDRRLFLMLKRKGTIYPLLSCRHSCKHHLIV